MSKKLNKKPQKEFGEMLKSFTKKTPPQKRNKKS